MKPLVAITLVESRQGNSWVYLQASYRHLLPAYQPSTEPIFFARPQNIVIKPRLLPKPFLLYLHIWN